MKELTVFMTSAGPNVFLENIKDTYETITKNLGHSDVWWYVVVDTEETEIFVKSLIPCTNLLKVVRSVGSWAIDFNAYFDSCLDKSRYLLIAQDDIFVDTPDFYKKTMEEISGVEDKVGWITYTNTAYYSVNAHNSVRGGFYKDRESFQVFECHNPNGDKDYPLRAVKCFGPYIHIMLVRTDILKNIGKCPDWTLYVMLLDENWCLKSLIKGYWNVWVPAVFYKHPNPAQVTRRRFDLRFERQGHEGFKRDWGFDTPQNEKEISEILQKWPHLSYLANKYSYEWDYLK
jgi:hypothetical protein